MALPGSGNALAASAINTELGRSSTATISLQTAATGGYVAINTNSTSRPNSTEPHAMSEWYSYNHSAQPPAASDITGASIIGSTQPGDGGGSIDVSFSLDAAIGTGYIEIEGVITAGDPITNTGSTGAQGPFYSSPATINAVLGSNAEGYVIVRLYNSSATLLDTFTTLDGILPL